MFIFVKTNKMEKEHIIRILEDQIFLANLFENKLSAIQLEKVLTYLNKQ
jgi:hypothetical protein